jgi:transcriptional regulator with XRE-family HTH domain
MVDLAAQLGISQGHLSNLENGHKRVVPELLEKIASVLGETIDVVAEAARSRKVEETKLYSWLSSVRINGLPLTRAFAYYLESKGLRDQALKDEFFLKQELKCFIEDNISYSIVAEMTENKNLIPNLRMHIAGDKSSMKEQTDHEQPTATE